MKHINAILLTVALGATVGLFFLLVENTNTPLFYFNLVFTCILEVLFFGSILKVSNTRWFNLPNVAVVAQIGYYVIITAIIMIIFNLLRAQHIIDIPLKWYYAALILITAIYGIVIIFTIKGADYQNKAVEKNAELQSQKQAFVQLKTANLRIALKKMLSQKDFDFSAKEACSRAVDLLIEKTNMIPLAKIERNPDYVAEVNVRLAELEDYIKNSDNDETVLANIKSKTQEINSYIDQTKQYLI